MKDIEWEIPEFLLSRFYNKEFIAEEDLQRHKRNRDEKYRTDKVIESDNIGIKLKTQAPDKSGRSHDED